MNKKIGILFTARNNYEMLSNWMRKVNTDGYEVLSIDEDSTQENKSQGKAICDEFNVKYMDRDERGMQHNIQTACDYFKDKGIEWVLWFQHDSYPKTEDFFNKLNTISNLPFCILG